VCARLASLDILSGQLAKVFVFVCARLANCIKMGNLVEEKIGIDVFVDFPRTSPLLAGVFERFFVLF